jgi:hypothetical protein
MSTFELFIKSFVEGYFPNSIDSKSIPKPIPGTTQAAVSCVHVTDMNGWQQYLQSQLQHQLSWISITRAPTHFEVHYRGMESIPQGPLHRYNIQFYY